MSTDEYCRVSDENCVGCVLVLLREGNSIYISTALCRHPEGYWGIYRMVQDGGVSSLET